MDALHVQYFESQNAKKKSNTSKQRTCYAMWFKAGVRKYFDSCARFEYPFC